MKIIKFGIGEELVKFLTNYATAVKTDEGNAYVQVTTIFKYNGQENSLEVIDNNNLPEDLKNLIENNGQLDPDPETGPETDPETEEDKAE